MADAFSSASDDIEAQRRAAVAAIAAGGAQGAQAFAQGQQQIEAARSAAINSALSEAAQRGQGDLSGMLGGIVGTPYSQLGAGLASSAASHAADAAARGAMSDNYFRQLGAAVPMARTQLETSIAVAKAKAAAKAAQEKALSDSELRTRLMGAGEVLRDQTIGDAQQNHHLYQTQVVGAKKGLASVRAQMMAVKSQLDRWQHGKHTKANGHDLVMMRNALQQQRNELEMKLAAARKQRAPFTAALKDPGTVESYARQAGIDAGEDPSRVLGLVQLPKEKQLSTKDAYHAQLSITEAAHRAGITGKLLKRITKPSGPEEATTHWEAIQSNAADYLKRGVPWETFLRDMKHGLRGHPRTFALAAAYWAPIFQARG